MAALQTEAELGLIITLAESSQDRYSRIVFDEAVKVLEAAATSVGGVFGAGATFGGILAYLFYRMASSERIVMMRNEQSRMDEIVKQSGDKDQRIRELHEQLAQMRLRLQSGTNELF